MKLFKQHKPSLLKLEAWFHLFCKGVR